MCSSSQRASHCARSLSQAARALKNANTIFIAGQLRSEPIAKFLRYVLMTTALLYVWPEGF